MPQPLVSNPYKGIYLSINHVPYCRHNEPAVKFTSHKLETYNKVFWKCNRMADSCRGWIWEEDLLTPVRERPPQAIEGAKQEPLFLTRRWTTAEYAPPEPSQSKSETPSSQETMIELPTTPKRVYKNLEMCGAAPPTPPPTQNKRKREGSSQARGRSTKRARSQTVNSDADNAESTDEQSASELSLLRTNARLSSLICTLEEEARRVDKAKDKKIASLMKQNKMLIEEVKSLIARAGELEEDQSDEE